MRSDTRRGTAVGKFNSGDFLQRDACRPLAAHVMASRIVASRVRTLPPPVAGLVPIFRIDTIEQAHVGWPVGAPAASIVAFELSGRLFAN